MQKTREYRKIAGQLYKNPSVQITEIAAGTGLSRNTVTKYMERMYSHRMLIGPWMSLKPHSNYREYVYLMNFFDPSKAFKGLKGFPHVVYCESAFGSWNIMTMTDQRLDFSRLKGFKNEELMKEFYKRFAKMAKKSFLKGILEDDTRFIIGLMAFLEAVVEVFGDETGITGAVILCQYCNIHMKSSISGPCSTLQPVDFSDEILCLIILTLLCEPYPLELNLQ